MGGNSLALLEFLAGEKHERSVHGKSERGIKARKARWTLLYLLEQVVQQLLAADNPDIAVRMKLQNGTSCNSLPTRKLLSSREPVQNHQQAFLALALLLLALRRRLPENVSAICCLRAGDLRRHFPDGVFKVTFGPATSGNDDNAARATTDCYRSLLGKLLGQPPEDEWDVKERLRHSLCCSKCLLLLDDVRDSCVVTDLIDDLGEDVEDEHEYELDEVISSRGALLVTGLSADLWPSAPNCVQITSNSFSEPSGSHGQAAGYNVLATCLAGKVATALPEGCEVR